jgi:hypothetical protein
MQIVGILEDAWRFFNKMASQDVVTWNAMIGTSPMGVGMMKMLQHTTSSSILLLLKGLPTRSLIPCAKRTIISNDYLNP